MELLPSQEDFIAHFGEMGSHWGINRTIGQIYALLYISKEPLCAEDISETLSVSRSNVSMSLRELESWRLLRVRHIKGDRKDYFTVPDDIWEIVRALIDERFKREIAPTLSVLRDILLKSEVPQEEHTNKKLTEMYELMELVAGWHHDLQKIETHQLIKMLQFGTKIFSLLEWKDKLFSDKTTIDK